MVFKTNGLIEPHATKIKFVFFFFVLSFSRVIFETSCFHNKRRGKKFGKLEILITYTENRWSEFHMDQTLAAVADEKMLVGHNDTHISCILSKYFILLTKAWFYYFSKRNKLFAKEKCVIQLKENGERERKAITPCWRDDDDSRTAAAAATVAAQIMRQNKNHDTSNTVKCYINHGEQPK